MTQRGLKIVHIDEALLFVKNFQDHYKAFCLSQLENYPFLNSVCQAI